MSNFITKINRFIRIAFGDATNIHMKAFFTNMTVKKLMNFFLVNIEFFLKKTKLKGKPYTLTIDPINICNLNCKYCPTGKGESFGREKKHLTFEEFKQIFDSVKDYVFLLNLYLWGEPFLNPEIFKMIKYAKKNNVFVSISTNLNVSNDFMEKIVDSKLDHLLIGIDGYNQKTYESYRKGGSFEKVIDNIKILKNIKIRNKIKYPILQGQYLVFKSNISYVKKMKYFVKQLKLDQFDFLSGSWTKHDLVYDKNCEARDDLKRKSCVYPWIKLLVYSDGNVGSCCFKNNKKFDLGNILESDFHKIWNSKKMINIRNYIIKKKGNNVPCFNCSRLK